MIEVWAPMQAYRVAVAELPLSTRPAEGISGAIAVLPGGADWVDTALRAAAGGAAAIVIADPSPAPLPLDDRLADVGVPLILERRLLCPELSAIAAAARSDCVTPVVAADAVAGKERLFAATCDALGWIRAMAGGRLDVIASRRGLTLLESDSGIAATISTVVTQRPGEGRVCVTALGERITRVTAEDRRTHVISSSREGDLEVPTRFESSERLALRRAVEAIRTRVHPTDLDKLVIDALLAGRILSA